VLKVALETGLTSSVVKSGFRSTGLYPLNRDAIDRNKLVGDSVNFHGPSEPAISLLMECDDDSTTGIFMDGRFMNIGTHCLR
jgi:hypothetical protein